MGTPNSNGRCSFEKKAYMGLQFANLKPKVET
jgi:hypothetical protein